MLRLLLALFDGDSIKIGQNLTVDLAFFSANLTKIFHGGWFPLVVAGIIFVVLSTWRRGRELSLARTRDQEIP
ncbi:MAG: KUP/HAK/KT family potassium transporter, partial [Nitrosomonas sp.]|nr:KUP/HAK/KT family potassium transporter [Nitrosomonas sp.]